jgi:hypothetical protein
MHAQIRTKPALSPADLAAFLQVLRDHDINMEGAGGSNIEHGGEFAFGLRHDDGDETPYDLAEQVLSDKGYKPKRVLVHRCEIPNEPGALLSCIEEAIAANQGTDQKIKDIAVGATTPDGLIQVQVYSEVPADPEA